ncbi:MAG: thioredoxin family protein [Victivallaceae bacterium]
MMMLLTTALVVAFAAGCGDGEKNNDYVINGENAKVKWYLNLDEAAKVAKKENKPLMVLFTGSDWCPWCIKLHNEILSQPEFETFAAAELVPVYLDFPNSKPQTDAERAANQAAASKFGIRGYPTIVFLSPDGKELARTGYQRMSAGQYADYVKQLIKQ